MMIFPEGNALGKYDFFLTEWIFIYPEGPCNRITCYTERHEIIQKTLGSNRFSTIVKQLLNNNIKDYSMHNYASCFVRLTTCWWRWLGNICTVMLEYIVKKNNSLLKNHFLF